MNVRNNIKLNKTDKIGVCSRSFSQNNALRSKLLEEYEHVKFNDDGFIRETQRLELKNAIDNKKAINSLLL